VNADVVRHALEAWNAQEELTAERFAEFAQPDMLLDLSSNVLNPGTYRGFEEFRQFMDGVAEAWAEFRMEPGEVFEREDLVVMFIRAVGVGRGSGVEIGGDVAVVCEMRDGLIATFKVEPDRAAARALVER
jgi:ketosteroid isomerase-like protein